MSDLSPEELLDLAEVYALDAIGDDERREIAGALAAASPDVRRRFDAVVSDVRETMAAHSAVDAVDPPSTAYDALMTEVAPARDSAVTDLASRRRRILLALAAAAVVVVVAVAGAAVVSRLGQTPAPPSAADQLMTASDLRTSSAPVPGGGSMTVLYSREANSAVVILNDVPAPAAESAYQMWQVPDSGSPTSVGVMDAAAISPSTQVSVHGIDTTSAIAVSVEPAGGSAMPTQVVVSVPLRD